MAWHRVCTLSEIDVGATRPIQVDGEYLLLCRVEEAAVHAIENICSHDDAPLDGGELEGRHIVCPRHGARFDVITGAVLRAPAPVGLETFPVRVTDEGWVEVEVDT